MKTDYIVKWSNRAKKQLFIKASYIKKQSMSEQIAQNFFNEITLLAEKLSYSAAAYNDGKFHIFPVKNGHSVKFLVVGDYVIISDFLPKGKNNS